MEYSTKEKTMKKQFQNFESAKKFVRGLGLKSAKEWYVYCKSGNKPDDVPSTPSGTYKNNGWSGFGDWLGTGTVAPKDKTYRSFKEAREFVRSLGLKGEKEWYVYCKSGNKPDDIPVRPGVYYKNLGFTGMKNWIGNEWRDFESAREFAKSLDLKNGDEWKTYCKSGNKPDDIPTYPNGVYKNKEWKGWGDWLGTGIVAHKDRVFRPFAEAREFVRSLNLKGQKEWQEYCKSGKKPDDISSNPPRVYKKEWKGWGDWNGTGIVANRNRTFRTFNEAKEFVRSLHLKGNKEWREYCKSGKKPDDMPTQPDKYYKNKGWKTWGEFLGTGTIANYNKEYRSFKEARAFVRKLGLKNRKEWIEYTKSGNKPDDIPAAPWNVYKEWNKK
jgi:hypothetical protein